MRRLLSVRWCYSMLLAVTLLFLCVGCGGGSSSSGMSPSDAQTIATQISQAAAQTANNAPSGTIRVDPHPQSITCTQNGCQIFQQFSSTASCSLGGNIGLTGDISGALDSTGTGLVQIQGQETLTDCSPLANYVLNGAPYISITGNFSFLNGNPSTQQSLTISGAFSYGSGASQVCGINLTTNFNANGSGTTSGTLCGQSVNVSF